MANSTQAHADSERLRKLADDLAVFSERIKDLDHDMQQGITRLGETFRDGEYEKFRAHFRGSRQKLLAFVDDVKALVPQLRADADDLAAASRVKLDI